MSGWYYKVSSDLGNIPGFIEYFNKEYDEARKDLNIRHELLEKGSAMLPGIVEYRFNQLQEIEAVLEYLNIELRKLKSRYFKKYLEAYNKSLSSRDAEKYIDGEPEVVTMMHLVNEVALIRNKYLGLLKGLEQKSWQLGNIVKLRVAGLDDAMVG